MKTTDEAAGRNDKNQNSRAPQGARQMQTAKPRFSKSRYSETIIKNTTPHVPQPPCVSPRFSKGGLQSKPIEIL